MEPIAVASEDVTGTPVEGVDQETGTPVGGMDQEAGTPVGGVDQETGTPAGGMDLTETAAGGMDQKIGTPAGGVDLTGTPVGGMDQEPGSLRRQSNIIPVPEYYAWERACDECGRVFAYLDVHLSRSELCRAAYHLRELRRRLGCGDQVPLDNRISTEDCQVENRITVQEENRITVEEDNRITAREDNRITAREDNRITAREDNRITSEDEEDVPLAYNTCEARGDEVVLTVSQASMCPRDKKNSNSRVQKLQTRDVNKNSQLMSQQLKIMQRQLQEFHQRLNKCEVLSKSKINRIATSGNPVATSGTAVATSGNAVATSGNAVVTSGNAVATSGNAVATSGNTFATSGNRSNNNAHLKPHKTSFPPSISLQDSELKSERRGDRTRVQWKAVFSDDDDEDLEILDKTYLLSALRKHKVPAVHKTYIRKSVCVHCGARMKYILSHLSKSFRCQVAYDMTHLRQQAELNKKIRQKYYLKHLKRKKKRPEVFEIVEQVRPRGSSQFVASNYSLQRRRGGRSRRIVQEEGIKQEKLSDGHLKMEDQHSNVLSYVPPVTSLAAASYAPRRLFTGSGHVTVSGPNCSNYNFEADSSPFESDYLCLDSSSSPSEDEPSEPWKANSPCESNFFSAHFCESGNRVSESAFLETADGNTFMVGDTVIPGPAAGGSSSTNTDNQSITRLKRPVNRVIRLTKAGKIVGGNNKSANSNIDAT